MAEFFRFPDAIPPDSGFSLFGRFHLAVLLLVALLCIATRYARRWTPAAQITFSHWFTGLMGGSELLRLLILRLTGHLTVYVLPLHLCSFAVWLCLWYAHRRTGWVGQTLYTLCLPGATAALLFPDWTSCPPWNYFCLHGFFIHAATVLFILLQLQTGRLLPAWRRAYQPMLVLGALVPPLQCVNRRFHTNYLFLSAASPGSPLTLLRRFPLGYLSCYLLLLLSMIAVMLLVWSLLHRRV